jgi:hypothetical protein
VEVATEAEPLSLSIARARVLLSRTEAEPLSLSIARARVLLSRSSVFSLLPCLVRARLWHSLFLALIESAHIWLPFVVLCVSARHIARRKARSPPMAEPDPCVLGPCAAVQSYNPSYYTPGALARPDPTCAVESHFFGLPQSRGESQTRKQNFYTIAYLGSVRPHPISPSQPGQPLIQRTEERSL